MKKHFLYVAMVLAMMSSCSNENDPLLENGQPGTDPVDPDLVELKLGVGAPDIQTRGSGSVGDVEGVNNVWNEQKLFIHMVDETGFEAKNGNDFILDNSKLDFIAPFKSNGAIRIYTKDSFTADTEGERDQAGKGTIQHLYYPLSGKFSFYGYHVDDATHDNATITGLKVTEPTSEGKKAVTNVIIDGTQDLLAAKSADLTEDANTKSGEGPENQPKSPYYEVANQIEDWTNLKLWEFDFSARTARKNINPVMQFKHQLARLKFFLRAGNEAAAQKKYNTSQWEDQTALVPKNPEMPEGEKEAKSTAIFVTKVQAVNMTNQVDMNLENQTSTAVAEKFATFDLKTGFDAENGKAPEYYPYSDSKVPDADKKGTYIGEILFFPNATAATKSTETQEATGLEAPVFATPEPNETAINLLIDTKQLLKDQTNEVEGTSTYKEVTARNNKLTLKASDIKLKDIPATKFEAGKSYNIYITLYGYEEIEISAELSAWEEGGDWEGDLE